MYGESSWVYTRSWRACFGKMRSSSTDASQEKGLSCNVRDLTEHWWETVVLVTDGGSANVWSGRNHPSIHPLFVLFPSQTMCES